MSKKKSARAERTKEKELAEWAEGQRALYRRGELSPERAKCLESLPGWRWEAKPRLAIREKSRPAK
jgi:hypothetical protein